MRIQNNITAMNTHRQYTINNDNVAASAKKLSSGYRINSAADDAAGLAISEKMRSQIRGLNMATKNSQDAISLVQTAEGALQETQNMLQRMNELAVQAATGTNETLDRNALAKEFEQLKREINDIAEQTTFNNMKILDGSLSYSGYVRSAATAGVTTTTEDLSNLPMSKNPVSEVENSAVAATPMTPAAEAADATTGKVTISGGVFEETQTATTGKAAGDVKYSFDFGSLASGPIEVNSELGAGNGAGAKKIGEDLADQLNADSTFTANYTATYSATDGLVIEAKNPGETAGLAKLQPTVTQLTKDPVSGEEDTDTKFVVANDADANSNSVLTITADSVLGKSGDATKVAEEGKGYTVGLSYTDADGASVEASVTVTATAADAGNSIGSLFDDQEIEINGAKFNMSWDDTAGKLTLTSAEKGADLINADSTTPDFKLNVKDASDEGGTGYVETAKPTIAAVGVDGTDATEATEQVDAVGASKTWNVNTDSEAEDGLKDGATLTIDGKTYTFKSENAEAASGQFSSLSDLESLINGNTNGTVTATDNGDGTITLQHKLAPDADQAAIDVANPNLDIEWAGTKGEGTRTTVEFDFAKLQEGDAVKITIGGKDITVTKEAGQTRKQFMDSIQDTLKNNVQDERVRVNGNALIAEGVEVKVDMKLAEDGLTGKKDTNALRIQVGALENEQLSIAIDSMNTAGLGLDDAFLMSQDNESGALTIDQDAAGAAITKTRAAINKISDQRATLGAMQNRLDHKIANLKIASENLSASESRIRDVDMASEMTNFTKNNILSQASTAMLAQANALPQNVLSLLG